ncbi:hypothetical protein PMI16_03466 [Herbaspirillum sp. CF444]|uniref:hypothetical protein n=1 Tax=Herbaspirillum sp. CF444 TaxID=1144319 RepID=UPI000272841F|nr:hypothetical protein [Herbaspirillum sp. CF444]EJL85499.1 hypothetical protein PMI16_03466 [Herbaspirillum sp. CF444]
MSHKIRKYLLAPFIYTAALLLLFEEWLWNASKRVLARLPLIPFIARLESWIGNFSPYAALAIFILPTLLLLPVKILALLSITHGHPTLGLAIIVTAKVLGTALVARLYALTQKALLTLPWFVRCHDAVLRFKDRMIAQLRATQAWRHVEAGMATFTAARRNWWRGIKARWHGNGQGNRLMRLIKKYAARRRDRSG